jgi:hypothetical protein
MFVFRTVLEEPLRTLVEVLFLTQLGNSTIINASGHEKDATLEIEENTV